MKSKFYLIGILTLLSPFAFADEVKITQAEYGEKWPFTVSEGVLSCAQVASVIFTAQGTTYAVNGKAKSWMKNSGWKSADEIWKDDPKNIGAKIDLGSIISRGLSLCSK